MALGQVLCEDAVIIVFHSETRRRHHSLELDGAPIAPSLVGHDRAEHVNRALDDEGAHETIDFDAFDEVHDLEYVRFLAGAWAHWRDEGHAAAGAMAFGWPARRFRNVRPDTLQAQLG